MTIGGTSDSDTQAGIFAPSNRAESIYTPASHGPCTEYCGRVYEAWRNYIQSSGVLASVWYSISTGCGTDEEIKIDKWLSVCSPYYESLWGGVGSPGASVSYRMSSCATRTGANSCPLGWGDYDSYQSYRPGCHYGSRYPNPTESSTSLSDVIGSPVLTTVII